MRLMLLKREMIVNKRMVKKDKINDFIPNDVEIGIVYEELYLNLKHQGYIRA